MTMASASDPLVLIVDDAGLRSSLTARLGLAGETVHIAAHPHDPALAQAVRRHAILIVDEARVPPEALDGGRAAFWPGPIILLGDRADDAGEARSIHRVERRSAPRNVPALVLTWRARAAG